ncbi:class F sortase, partial [Streptomyces massasporeus]
MRRFPRFGSGHRDPANAAMAAVTVFALCSGVWLLRDGAGTHAPP